MRALKRDPFFDEATGFFTLNGRTFKLDPDEQAESNELDRLEAAGLLKSALTPERKKELQQTAANSIEMRRLARRDLIEDSKEPAPVPVKHSSARPLHPWKKTAGKSASPALRKSALAVA